MQRLLSSSKQPERPRLPETAPRNTHLVESPTIRAKGSVALSPTHLVVLQDIQSSLRNHSIEADLPDVVQALMESLAARPTLCKGLIAAYLLETPVS